LRLIVDNTIAVCLQLGEWVFIVSGTGLLPQPQAPVSVFSPTTSSTNIIIPFRNPMDVPVSATIMLKGQFSTRAG
jgi:hypothetical protein